MVQIFKQILCLAVLALSLSRAAAFSLIEPFEAWQIQALTYRVGGDLGGPANLGEEYRRNIPVLYYSFDLSFLEYFGSNGVVAIEEAIAIMNNLTNVSSYSADLSEFPLEAQRYNFRAQALSLSDLKSWTLNLLTEQMGLAPPDRYTWTLRERAVGTGGCPEDVGYGVIKRNFEILPSGLDAFQASSYVNGTLYSYQIVEFCQNTPFLADAVEFPVDPLANTYTAVASDFRPLGSFYTGLTRDDVAGLRYLMRTNNYNTEAAGGGAETFITNNTIALLYTSNLTFLVEASLTNDAAALAALFPGLEISSTTSYFTNVVSTNTVFSFVNSPFNPAIAPAQLVSATVVTTNITTHYRHQFANVITNTYSTTGTVTVVTTNISTAACSPFLPAGLICFSITSSSYTTNGVFGDYYLIPTNQCGVGIIQTQLVVTAYVTNTTVATTNGVVNLVTQEFSQTRVYPFTQHVFAYNPITCPDNSVAMRQGIERVQFVRRDFDSLLGRFFYPITNEYNLVALTNNSLLNQRVRRVVTAPDFLVDAEDLGTVVVQSSVDAVIARRTIGYSTNGTIPGLNGPGTIDNAIRFTYNKVGPFYYNYSATSLDEASQTVSLIWGSFDASTNAPVVYPNGTSIENLENQLLIQVSPVNATLPNAILAVNYTNQFTGFTVVGGIAPYVWSLAPGSAGLPFGLTLNASTGRISGVPTFVGTYDFSVRLTESTSRFVDRTYSITVTP